LKKTKFDFQEYKGDSIVDDKTTRKAVCWAKRQGIEVIVCCQVAKSDGRLAPVLHQSWDGVPVFWATPEEPNGSMISGNSLVGTHLYCASLRQLGRRFELVAGNRRWDLHLEQLKRGVYVAFATRMIRKAKLGLIGSHAPGFSDFQPRPSNLSKTFGSIFQTVDLNEYMGLYYQISDDAIEAEVENMSEIGIPFLRGAGTREDLPKLSRHYLAMKKIIEKNNFDGLAIRCWPELPSKIGVWPYYALARLSTKGFPVACEGDVDGCLGALVGKLLGFGAVFLSHWLEHDAHTLTLWNGGMAPFQLCEKLGSPIGPCHSKHFNNHAPGCVDATIKEGMKVTIYRFWVTDDVYHLLALEGETIVPKRHLLGNNGLVQFSRSVNLIEGFESWIHKGFPHHVSVVEGHHLKTLRNFCRGCNVVFLTA